MIRPDDPRHGTYAGYIAHLKYGVPTCDPCHREGTRKRKLLHLRGPQKVRLGVAAWKVLQATPANVLAEATGMHQQPLTRLRHAGPDQIVYRRTRRAILTALAPTPIGLARRLQGLAVLGYSCAALSRRSQTVHADSLKRIRRGETAQVFVRRSVAAEIVRLYDQLHMTPAAYSRSATRSRADAVAAGWVSPLAWDNIDDPEEMPQADPPTTDEVDEAAIWRRMHGDRTVQLTEPEQDELVRRCLTRGWTWERIETVAGVNMQRVHERLREVA